MQDEPGQKSDERNEKTKLYSDSDFLRGKRIFQVFRLDPIEWKFLE